MSGFVKLDDAMTASSIWADRPARSVFITALLMAKPFELRQPAKELKTRSLEETGFIVPEGWYGMVTAAWTGIIARDGIDRKAGAAALERLASPDPASKSSAFEGRRMVRVENGFIILNFFKFRDQDYTNADRQARFRERERQRKGLAPAP